MHTWRFKASELTIAPAPGVCVIMMCKTAAVVRSRHVVLLAQSECHTWSVPGCRLHCDALVLAGCSVGGTAKAGNQIQDAASNATLRGLAAAGCGPAVP
jgi:hypothetical protein